jgi:hypothetical protein
MGKPLTHAPADNTEAVVTIAASAGVAHEIEFIGFSYDEAPAAAKLLTIESPATTVLHTYYITSAGPGPIQMSGSCLRGAKGSALVVRLAAGGAGIAGSLNVIQRDR